MKNISLHTPSLVVGLGLAALLGVAMSQQVVGSPAIDIRRVIEPVANYPHGHPRDYVRIVEGVPYVVPSGRTLVVTGLGSGTTFHLAELWIDGVREVTGGAFVANGGMAVVTSIAPLPEPGEVVQPGQLVEVKLGAAPVDDARAWGYLADL